MLLFCYVIVYLSDDVEIVAHWQNYANSKNLQACDRPVYKWLWQNKCLTASFARKLVL